MAGGGIRKNLSTEEIKLSKLVKDRPAIWDKSDDAFRDATKKLYAWQDVASHMVEDYYTVSYEERVKIRKEIMKKYTKYKRYWSEDKKRYPQPQSSNNVRSKRIEAWSFLEKNENKGEENKCSASQNCAHENDVGFHDADTVLNPSINFKFDSKRPQTDSNDVFKIKQEPGTSGEAGTSTAKPKKLYSLRSKIPQAYIEISSDEESSPLNVTLSTAANSTSNTPPPLDNCNKETTTHKVNVLPSSAAENGSAERSPSVSSRAGKLLSVRITVETAAKRPLEEEDGEAGVGVQKRFSYDIKSLCESDLRQVNRRIEDIVDEYM